MLDQILPVSIFFESDKPSGENIFEKIKLQCCLSFARSYNKSTHGFFIYSNIKSIVIIFPQQNEWNIETLSPALSRIKLTQSFRGTFMTKNLST